MIKLHIDRVTEHGKQWVTYTFTASGIEDPNNLVVGISFHGSFSDEMHDNIDPNWVEDGKVVLEKRRYESNTANVDYPDYVILYRREDDGTLKALARKYYSHTPDLEWTIE